MLADKTTLKDLSIFNHEEEQSVFHLLDFTRTIGGKDWLRVFLSRPFSRIKDIKETQQILQRMGSILPHWPESISNGTIMVVGKFFETPVDSFSENTHFLSGLLYKIFNNADYSIIRYSVSHTINFLKGLQEIVALLNNEQKPPLLQAYTDRIESILNKPRIQQMLQVKPEKKLSPVHAMNFGYFIRHHFKNEAMELMEIYSKLDAYYSMAKACEHHRFSYPEFIESDQPVFSATQLYHPLLPTPVSYDINLEWQKNFLFLTGANMAGKSTFIKAVGVAAYLAHTGMAVPAQSVQLSLFDGLLSNIHVEDNIVKGESYFYNEVQRIRKTIEKISDGKKWLILIDELFKGTNVQDAMKCSTTVIEGLLKMQNALFILSTHLYEIGEELKRYPNIQFRYFETEVKEDQLLFSYNLKEGISNDRLGYLILKKEGVVELLSKL